MSLTRRLTQPIRNLITRWDEREHARWADQPAGCCQCGTGGPYYRGSRTQVTRYVYVGACRSAPRPGSGGTDVDWTTCSRHALPWLAPVVDYGSDVVVTFARTERDAAEALASGLTHEPGNGSIQDAP